MYAYYSILFLSILLLSGAANVSSTTFDVVNFGAKPDVEEDSADSFLTTWSLACSSPSPATVHVPSGKFFISQAIFNGPCRSPRINFSVNGTLVAPSGYDPSRTLWIAFNDVSGVSISGGVLNGTGQQMWDCKLDGEENCPDGASSLTFNNARHVTIDGIRLTNSQFFHIVLLRCYDVKVRGVYIDAPDNSPNTDGIHIQQSSSVDIINSNIMTGDDCISIGPETSHIWIENIFCGPGHGISIGSLGMENNFQYQKVKHITVKNATLSGTQNGVRIKTWATLVPGIVHNVTFEDVIMLDVQNPIIIDQNYCPFSKEKCPRQRSMIKINNVKYNNIRGTSKSQESIYFDCSARKPCINVRLQDINLQYQDQQQISYCRYASGKAYGVIVPQSCLSEEV